MLAADHHNLWRLISCACLGLALTVAAAKLPAADAPQAGAAGDDEPGDASKEARAVSPAVAWINDEPIPSSLVERGVGEVLVGQIVTPEMLTKARAAVLQKLIEQKLFINFLDAQRLPMKREEVEAAMVKVRQSMAKQNLKYEDLVASGKISEDSLRLQIALQLAWDKFVRRKATEEVMQEFYDEVHERYDGTQRRVSHILLRPGGMLDEAAIRAVTEEAKRLQTRIATGKISFEEAAKRYSAGPSRRKGGDLGYVTVGGGMNPQFELAAFDTRPGDISTPTVTGFGVHLIKVTEVKPGNKSWREVADKLLPALAERMRVNVLEEQFRTAKIEFAANVPHYVQGTTNIVVSPTKTTVKH